MSGPLSHLTVIELAGIGPGPFACMMLADLGARVVRVDRPNAARGLDGLFRNDGFVDRGRQSIALDLKKPESAEVVLRLVERADILVEGFRPGVAERMGLGPEVCLARNPRLVYGRMTGWGQNGPYATMAGHDINYIGLTGALHAIGPPNGPPVLPLNLVGDYGGGGMYMAFGLLAALTGTKVSGRGQVVDAAMVDGSALLMAPIYGMLARGLWREERGANFLDGGAHFYGAYECADGKYMAVGAIEPQFYKQLLDICGVTDPAFEAQWDRRAWPALREKLASVFRTRARAQWTEVFDGTDACVTPILAMSEAADHSHNVARGSFASPQSVPQPAPPPWTSEGERPLPGAAPAVGGDTRAILSELGYADGVIAQWLCSGIMSQAD